MLLCDDKYFTAAAHLKFECEAKKSIRRHFAFFLNFQTRTVTSSSKE